MLSGSRTERAQTYVLAVLGSRGDVYPMLAVGGELKRRGHQVRFAVQPRFQPDVEKFGLEYRMLRPETEPEADPSWDEAERKRRATSEHAVKQRIYPAVEETFRDLLAACEGADMLIYPFFLFPGQMAAERCGIPYAVTYFSPGQMNSVYDPPLLPPLEFIYPLQRRSLAVAKFIHRFAAWFIRSWAAPLHELRAREGFVRLQADPLLSPPHSPWLTLALFSAHFGAAQPDWPRPTLAPGFPFLEEAAAADEERMQNFVRSGPAPIVATLGSSSSVYRRRFFEATIEAAAVLGQRLLLIAGDEADDLRGQIDAAEVMVTRYAPYSLVFPAASCLVLAGSVGPISHGMRAGRPMLVVASEHAADQPDAGARCQRMGVARWMHLRRYDTAAAVDHLRNLLVDSRYTLAAEALGEKVRREDAIGDACDAMEAVVARQVRSAVRV